MAAAFDIITGTATIASSATTVTLTESTDYTLPAGADNTNCFIQLVNSRLTGMGDTVGGGEQNTSDFTVRITNPGNIATSITFERANGAAFACRFTYSITCYIGASGGANEFIVREVGILTGSDVNTLSTTAVSGIVTDADVLPMITSQSTANATSGDWHACLFYSTWNAGTDIADFDTDGGTVASPSNQWVSYAIIEFTGSNWTLDRVSTTAETTLWTGAGNNSSFTVAHGVTISDLTKAVIIHSQYSSTTGTMTVHKAGCAVMIDSTTNLRLWLRNGGGVQTKVVWILQNSQASGTVRNMKSQHVQYIDDTTSGSEERVFTFNLTTDPDTGSGASIAAPLAETSAIITASMDGGGTFGPRGSIDLRITAANEMTFSESENSQERRMCVEVMEWPEDEAAAGGAEIFRRRIEGY